MTDYEPGPCDVCGEDIEVHTRNQLTECIQRRDQVNIEPGPGDDRTRYDANEQQRQHPSGWLVKLNEPPIGTVVAFSVVHLGGKVYDYASIRAGNGLWYTTGGRAMQGVTWSKLVDSVRERAAGPLRIMRPGQAYYF